jgi:hypothetical protein
MRKRIERPAELLETEAVRTIEAQESVREEPDAEREARVAVLICHGMVQQVPFATLADVAEAIRVEHGTRGGDVPSVSSVVEYATVGGEQLPRARLRFAPLTSVPAASVGEPSAPQPVAHREAHLYEAYWADKSAGQIGGLATLWFLLTAGANGLRFSRRRKFRRWMFGGERDCRLSLVTTGSLAIALALILALLSVAAAYFVIVFANVAVRFDHSWERSLVMTSLQPRYYATALALVAVSLVYIFVLVAARRRSLLTVVANALYGAALLGTLVSAGAGCAYWMLISWDDAGPASKGLFRAAVDTAFANPPISWLDAAGTALLTPYLSLFAADQVGITALPRALAAGIFWLGIPLLFLVVRYFLIEYLGDVAIYLSAHKVNRFAEAREKIQAECLRVARAIYARDAKTGHEYETIVVVGHSLGSVLAYDTLNRLCRDDLVDRPDEPPSAVLRTPVLLTFGSPLDKIAFLFRAQATELLERSALLAARQPLIRDYAFRPERWINIYTPYDWIGGTLDYFDRPVETMDTEAQRKQRVTDVEDESAFVPLVAHTGYWSSSVFRSKLYDSIAGMDPIETEPRGSREHELVGPRLDSVER